MGSSSGSGSVGAAAIGLLLGCVWMVAAFASCTTDSAANKPGDDRGGNDDTSGERGTPGKEDKGGGDDDDGPGGGTSGGPAWEDPSWYFEAVVEDDETAAACGRGIASGQEAARGLAMSTASSVLSAVRETRVSSFFGSVQESEYATDAEGEPVLRESARSFYHVTSGTAETLRGIELLETEYDTTAAGNAIAFVKIRVSQDWLRPERRLQAWLAAKPERGTSDNYEAALADWLARAEDVATYYRVAAEPTWEVMVWQLVADFDRSWPNLQRLARLYEQQGQPGKALTLLQNELIFLPADAQDIARQWIARLDSSLPTWDEGVEAFGDRVEDWQGAGGILFRLSGTPRVGQRITFGVQADMPGHLTTLWLDADGLYAWTSVGVVGSVDDISQIRSSGPLTTGGQTTVFAFVSPVPLAIDDLLPILAPTNDAERIAAVTKLGELQARLNQAVADTLGEGTAATAVRFFVTGN